MNKVLIGDERRNQHCDRSLSFEPHVHFGSRLCENSDVELPRRMFFSMTLNKKRTTLAGAVKRRKERKQFCAFSARGRFHTAWVIFRLRAASQPSPLIPQLRTCGGSIGMSQKCQRRKLRAVEAYSIKLCCCAPLIGESSTAHACEHRALKQDPGRDCMLD